MKKYAVITSPEGLSVQYFMDLLQEFNNIVIDGGREFTGYNDDIIKRARYLYDNYEGYDYTVYYNSKLTDFLSENLPEKQNGKKWAPCEVARVRHILTNNNLKYSEALQELTTALLSILNGEKYGFALLRGSMQCEVVGFYYPLSYTHKDIDYIEGVFFGTGALIVVDEQDREDDEEVNPEDIDGYSFYTVAYNSDDIKKEVAENEGCKPEEVELYAEDYITVRKPVYKKM